MKGFGILFMLLLIGTAILLYLGYSSKDTTILNSGMVSIGGSMNAMTLTMLRRKLKLYVMVQDARYVVHVSVLSKNLSVNSRALKYNVPIGHESVTFLSSLPNLQENMNPSSKDKYYNNDVDLQDYHPIDPVPSSRDYIHTGPIEHGTPLMPYVPGPSPPPEQEKYGEFH